MLSGEVQAAFPETTRTVLGVAPSPSVQGTAHGRRKKRAKRKSKSGARSHDQPRRRERAHHRDMALAKPKTPILVASPGPAQTPEAERAMDKVRLSQIERAEGAARRADLTNRWDTVSFLLSGVDDQRYPSAGFWKAVALYRRGRLSDGDSVRQHCMLSAADARALDGERSVATMLAAQSGGGTELRNAALVSAAEKTEGVTNNAAYTGPGPTAASR
jgi:hypothetical protein